jgi:hypothetical protein
MPEYNSSSASSNTKIIIAAIAILILLAVVALAYVAYVPKNTVGTTSIPPTTTMNGTSNTAPSLPGIFGSGQMNTTGSTVLFNVSTPSSPQNFTTYQQHIINTTGSGLALYNQMVGSLNQSIVNFPSSLFNVQLSTGEVNGMNYTLLTVVPQNSKSEAFTLVGYKGDQVISVNIVSTTTRLTSSGVSGVLSLAASSFS